MIQRIQTIYLVLGALALAATLFFDALWQSPAATTFVWFGPLLALTGGLACAVALGAVFLYKNRERQRKTVVLVQGLTVAFTFVLYLGLFLVGAFAESLPATLLLALVLPVLAYVMFYLARRGIVHDIELVRSMDRLRG